MLSAIKLTYTFFYNVAVILRNRAGLSVIKQSKLFIFYIKINGLALLGLPKDQLVFDGLTINFPNLRSFINSFGDCFVRNEYFLRTAKLDPFIIDGGANIGDTLLYFKYYYPNAELLLFEPDKASCLFLKKNIKVNRIKNVLLIKKALSNKVAKIKFYPDKDIVGGGRGSLLAERTNSKAVPAITTKLSKYITKPVDLLKLDIEGAETDVVSDLFKSKKLKFVKSMYIEYHHHINNKKDNLSEILGYLEKSGFRYQIATGLNYPFEKNIFQDILIYAYVT